MPTNNSLYTWRVCFHRDLYRFLVLWLLLYYSCLHTALPLVFYSISLLLLFYFIMCIPCLMSLAIYLPAHVCLCSRPSFQCMFMIQIYRYTRERHLALASPLTGEFWLPWILMSRSQSLEHVDSPSCRSEWRSWSVDLQQTVWSSIFPGPPVCLSSFPFVNSWVPVYCSYLYISL